VLADGPAKLKIYIAAPVPAMELAGRPAIEAAVLNEDGSAIVASVVAIIKADRTRTKINARDFLFMLPLTCQSNPDSQQFFRLINNCGWIMTS
jgi:hypothetical protein